MLTQLTEQERKVKVRQAAEAMGFNLEELELLSRLFQEASWPLLQRYLGKWEQVLNNEMWAPSEITEVKVHFLKGQMNVVKSLQNLPIEVMKSKEALKQAPEKE